MAEFRINVVVDPTGAVAGTRRVEGALEGVGNRAGRLRSLLTRAFGVLAAGASIGAAVRVIADFEQAMSNVRAVSGATEEQFASLSSEAQRLGSTTRFSATQAAEGMAFLARAGFDANESLVGVESTLRLAQAGGLELASAADIASNVLSGFGLEVGELTRVVDVLAAGAASSNTSVEQLGQAMSFAAPVASGLGLSVEETAAAIGVLSDAGIQATRAGTGLNRVLAELESPGMVAQGIFDQLGVSVASVRPSAVGLESALTTLAAAGVDTGLAFELFGQRGGPAFGVLANGIPRVRELTGELSDSAGAADRMASIMDDNLSGSIQGLISAVQGLVIGLGETGLTSVLRAVIDATAFFIRTVGTGLRIIGAWVDTVQAYFTVLSDGEGIQNASIAAVQAYRDGIENIIDPARAAREAIAAANMEAGQGSQVNRDAARTTRDLGGVTMTTTRALMSQGQAAGASSSQLGALVESQERLSAASGNIESDFRGQERALEFLARAARDAANAFDDLRRSAEAAARAAAAASRRRSTRRLAEGTDFVTPGPLLPTGVAPLLALPGFQGGTPFVSGPAGRDRVPALLTRGEGVVTAAANRANPGVVRRLNEGESVGATYVTNISVSTPDADSFRRSREQIRRREFAAQQRAERRNR